MGWSSRSVTGRYALVAASSGLVGWLAASWLSFSAPVLGSRPSPARPPTPENHSADWDRLHLRLDALQQRVDAALAERSRQPVADTEEPTASEAGAAHKRIEAILGRLERLAPSLWSGTKEAPLPRLPVNWDTLNSLHRLSEGDEKAAKRSTLLLSPSEVVARFGFPTEVGGSNGGSYWRYARIGPDGKQTGSVTFAFHEGRVAYHEIDLPAR